MVWLYQYIVHNTVRTRFNAALVGATFGITWVFFWSNILVVRFLAKPQLVWFFFLVPIKMLTEVSLYIPNATYLLS